MKSVKESLLERRSIRAYKPEAISPEQLDFIYEAIRNTPTSVNGQQFSVIDVTDPELKGKMYELTGMKHVETCSHFFLFCADYHKAEVAADAEGIALADFHDTAEGLLVGTVDATLAMMSAIVAAESLGLGSCCIGFARIAAPREISDLVGLPKSVYVVCGLTVGVPDELPDLKPKQPVGLSIHKERYPLDDDMRPLLQKYNEEIDHYNKTRSGSQSDFDWIHRIAGYYEQASQLHMLEFLRSQGFGLKQ